MPTRVITEVDGVEALRRNVSEQIPYGIRTALRAALSEQGRELRDTIKDEYLSGQVLHRRTSRLYRSVRTETSGREGEYLVKVFTDALSPKGAPYPRFQEFGFTHAGSGRFIHNPTFAPALRQRAPSIRAALQEAVRAVRP